MICTESTINFGRHKGKTVMDIWREDPNYICWLTRNRFVLNNCKKLVASIKDLNSYLKKKDLDPYDI